MAPAVAAQSAVDAEIKKNLYFLSATVPLGDVQYPAELYGFASDGRFVLMRDVATKHPGARGVDFVLADYESRLIIIGSPNVVPDSLKVILMDFPEREVERSVLVPDVSSRGVPWEPWPAHVQAGRSRARDLRVPDRASLISARFIQDPRGKVLTMLYGSDRGVATVGYPVRPDGLGTPIYLTDADLTNVRSEGTFGMTRLGFSDAISVRSVNGRLLIPSHLTRDIGRAAPPDMSAVPGKEYLAPIHTDRLTVVCLPSSENQTRLAVWSASAGKWTSYVVPGRSPKLRHVGNWILGVSASPALGRVSPGAAERKARAGADGRDKKKKLPDTDYFLRDSNEYYPGHLFLVDTQSGRVIQFETGQGDSEVLLVRGEYVYYRVNHRLYAATISKTGIVAPQLLAEQDAIRDIHWAFWK